MTKSDARYPMPSFRRIVVGLTLAGFAPAGLVGLVLGLGDLRSAVVSAAEVAAFYGIAPALTLGLPAIYILRGVIRPTLAVSLIAGMIVASAPFGLLTLKAGADMLWWLIAALPLGAIGGAIFWRVTLQHLKPIEGQQSAVPPY